jgi:hypothetical protein
MDDLVRSELVWDDEYPLSDYFAASFLSALSGGETERIMLQRLKEAHPEKSVTLKTGQHERLEENKEVIIKAVTFWYLVRNKDRSICYVTELRAPKEVENEEYVSDTRKLKEAAIPLIRWDIGNLPTVDEIRGAVAGVMATNIAN